jgi:ATP-dependent DNA helicase RecQ
MLDAPIAFDPGFTEIPSAPDTVRSARPADTAPASPGEALLPLLERHFGFTSFRPFQEEIITDALAGKDVLAILPTGGGKSLCFQLPAVARPGLSVVVSPLIALMKDQVDSLAVVGIPATYLSSTLGSDEARLRMKGLREGRYSLLYVAPERLLLPGFLASLKGFDVRFLAVDEAHCISQWGHDFRPEYRRIADLRRLFPRAPVMALSATATDRVRADIIDCLRLREPSCYVASFDRPNLLYRVEPKTGAFDRLLALCRRRSGETGIVYAHSRHAVEQLATRLRREHVNAAPYHAGLEPARRAQTQEAFARDAVRVICATVAFGMGVNKSNVRFVVHHDLPGDIEGYYQETGRAGRDGLPGECVLFFAPGDAVKQARFIDQKPDPEERARARRKLSEMLSFAESSGCRRRALLAYFGEARGDEPCGACDNCLSPREPYDGTVEAQKMMSCVLRIQQHSGLSVGLHHVVAVLCGAESEKIQRLGHADLSTYGIGKDRSRAQWMAIGRELLRLGLLRMTDHDRFSVLEVTQAGREALSKRAPVMLTRPVATRGSARAGAKGTLGLARGTGTFDEAESPVDEALFERLRALRKSLADERDVPAYVIFSDLSLREMAATCPTDPEAFGRVHGVGQRRLADLGPAFIGAIREHVEGRATNTAAEVA